MIWVIWALTLAGSFGVLEYRGWRNGHTLTSTIKRNIPAWVFWTVYGAASGWWIWHFHGGFKR